MEKVLNKRLFQIKMGVDGRLLVGDGILINPKYLSEADFNFLDQLGRKYPYIFEYNYMDGVIRDHWILVWGQEPEMMFPLDVDRRPLILRNELDLELMVPKNGEIDLDSTKLWNASYEDFAIRLTDYWENPEEIRTNTLTWVQDQTYETNSEYLDYPSGQPVYSTSEEEFKLTSEEFSTFQRILIDPNYTLVGKWLMYIAN